MGRILIFTTVVSSFMVFLLSLYWFLLPSHHFTSSPAPSPATLPAMRVQLRFGRCGYSYAGMRESAARNLSMRLLLGLVWVCDFWFLAAATETRVCHVSEGAPATRTATDESVLVSPLLDMLLFSFPQNSLWLIYPAAFVSLLADSSSAISNPHFPSNRFSPVQFCPEYRSVLLFCVHALAALCTSSH